MLLTEKVLLSQKEGKVSTELINVILGKTYSFLVNVKRGDPDLIGDFILYFHDKIPNMVLRFIDRGILFENYLYTTINYRFRTFQKEEKNRLRDNEIGMVAEQEVAYNTDFKKEPALQYSQLPSQWEINDKGCLTNHLLKKRLLILLVKNAYFIKDYHIKGYALLLGQTEKELFDFIEPVRKELTDEYNEQPFFPRRNKVLIKLKQLEAEKEDDNAKQIKKLMAKLDSINQRIKDYSPTPSHRRIAEVIGLPKGSVDSSLFYLRKEIEKSFPDDQNSLFC
ncbi:hypothetical protein [Spirochaeta cellobiosiphila]|uniref:hypothetical protein n=1 Tax=Spirochaeta cellobiosiphila TaxID=504483 RepID=UPI000402B1AA|nr:hypothetical protein [Spirochaeta cellobiosiphila]